MQIRLNNSNLTLLLPKDYDRVDNGAALYDEMYHAGNRRDIQMFQNLAARSCGNIVISHIDAADAMPLGDKEALIKEIHDSLEDNQGLIEVECGTNPRGYEYIYSIIKTYHQEKLSANYCLRMDIRNGDELIEVSASFFEMFMTGERSSFAWAMSKNAGIEEDPETHFPKGWFRDPYDPEYDKGSLMIMAESRGFDGLFPADPLSQARELVLALTEDSWYKTREEIEAESEEKKKEEKKSRRKAKKNDPEELNEDQDKQEEVYAEDGQDLLRRMFSGDASRAGAYKVDIIGDEAAAEPEREPEPEPQKKKFSLKPSDIAKAAADAAGDVRTAVTRTAAELDKVKTPFDIPDDFRNKLNQSIKEIPGWGKRQYIGFGKRTFGMSALLIT